MEVAVEGSDDWGGAGDDSGPKSGALAGIFLMPESPDVWIEGMSFNDLTPGGIGTPIVHKNELVVQIAVRKGIAHLTEKRKDIGLLIVDRHDDR